MNKTYFLIALTLSLITSSCGLMMGSAAVGGAAYAYDNTGIARTHVSRPIKTSWELSQVFFEDLAIVPTNLSRTKHTIEGTYEEKYTVRISLKKTTERTTEVTIRVWEKGIPQHGKAKEMLEQLQARLS